MAGAINVQVTINAKDNGAAQQLLALKRAAGELGVQFNVTTAAGERLGSRGSALGRDLSGGFAGAIEGATGLRTALAQVALGYEAVHATREAIGEGFTAASSLEQAKLGTAAEIAANTTVTDPSGKAIEGQEKLALATALANTEMQRLVETAAKVGITGEEIADIYKRSVSTAIRNSATDVQTTLANLAKESLQFAVLGRTLGVPYEQVQQTLLQILNGHVQQRNALVAVLGITKEDLAAAKERGTVQELLNAKLKAYGELGAEAATNLRGIQGIIKASFESSAEQAVEPLVTVIEQKIGPAFQKLDTSGITRAIQAVATQGGTVLGELFDKASKGAEHLAEWLDKNPEKVNAAAAEMITLVSEIASAVAGAGKLVATFVELGVTSGVVAGAAHSVADLLALAEKLAPELAAVYGVTKLVAFVGALGRISTTAIATATRVKTLATELNASGIASGLLGDNLRRIALGRLGAEGVIAAEGITASGVAAGVATVAFGTLAATLTTVGLVLAAVGAAYEIWKGRQDAARAAQEAHIAALSRAIQLAPDLISQLHEEEEAANKAGVSTAAHAEHLERIHEIQQKLLGLSPDFVGAIGNQTEAMAGLAAEAEKVHAAHEKNAEDELAAAQREVARASYQLQQTQLAIANPQGGGDEGALASSLPALQEQLSDAEELVAKLQGAYHPSGAQSDETRDLDAVKRRTEAKRALIDESYARGEIDAKKYQADLNKIEFDGAKEEIKIRTAALALETNPEQRTNEIAAIVALRQKMLNASTLTPDPQEADPAAARKAQELRETQAAAQRSIIAEQTAASKQATEDLYKQKLITVQEYYTRLANVEYEGYQREVAVDEQLLQTETDPRKRTELLAQIDVLNQKSVEATRHTTALEIEALDELEKKRVEAARTSITEQTSTVRDTLTARVDDIHTQTDVGTITKAEGAQQLTAAYGDALSNLRALYQEAVAFAAETGNPKDALEVEKIATAYGQIQIEARKAAEASSEFAKDLGTALEHSFDSLFGGSLERVRRFSTLMRQELQALVKDLQHALAETIGKKIKTGVEKILTPKPPASTTEPIGAQAEKLSVSAADMQAAAAAWERVAAQFAQIGVPTGRNPFVPPARAVEPPAPQAGNVTQSGVATVSPDGETIAPPGAPVAPTLGVPGGDGGVGAVPDADVPAAGTPNADVPYAGGGGGPSGELKSVTSVAGIASQFAGLVPGAGPALSKALGMVASYGGAAEKAAYGQGVAPGLPSQGGGGAAGSNAIASAAAAIRASASQLSSSAQQLSSAAQQLTQAASALTTSGGSGGGGGPGGLSSLMDMFGGGEDASGLGDLAGEASGAAAFAAQGGFVSRMSSGGLAPVRIPLVTLARTYAPFARFARGGQARNGSMMLPPAPRYAGGGAADRSPHPAWAVEYGRAIAPTVRTLARGGPVWGAGTATSDSIPAYLSHGEYVVNADSVQKMTVPVMHAINAGKFTHDSHNSIKLASGGLISPAPGGGARGAEGKITAELGFEEGLVVKHMRSSAGQAAMFDAVSTSPGKYRQAIGMTPQ